jgi:hypothetical protein
MANAKPNPEFYQSVVKRNFGKCPNSDTIKTDSFGANCFGGCDNNPEKPKLDEAGSNCGSPFFGICPDGVTLAQNNTGTNCFGPCASDYSQYKKDDKGTNCPGYSMTDEDIVKSTPTSIDAYNSISQATQSTFGVYIDTPIASPSSVRLASEEIVTPKMTDAKVASISDVIEKTSEQPRGVQHFKLKEFIQNIFK